MDKVLVTGASGFIGSTLCDMLLQRGDKEVWAAIRKSSSKKYLQSEKLHFIELDYTDPETLRQQLANENFSTIFHLAGLTKAKNQEQFDKVNFHYTQNLVQAIKNLDVKLIYMSSFAAHGPAEIGTKAKVCDQNKPNTKYGISKLKAEQYINQNCSNKYIILRPTGVYGPRETDYFVFFQTIKNHIDAALGWPKQILSFIYSKDLCQAAILAMENYSLSGKTYFVADGNVYLDNDFSRISKQALNTWVIPIRFPLFIVKGIVKILDFVGKIFRTQFTLNSDKYNILAARNWDCDIEDLKADLGFKPEYDLKRGVEETIGWYKQNHWL